MGVSLLSPHVQKSTNGLRSEQADDPDEIYQLLVNSQSRRLDDQRVMLTSSPGMEAFTIKEQKETNTLKKSYDHICNMVSGAHSFRRRSPRKMPMTPASPNFSLSNPTERCDHPDSFNKLPSVSFSPISDKDQMDYDFQGEQDQLFCLVSQAQRGSLDKQRCSINPLSHSSRPSDLHLQTDQEAEQFFNLIANTQNRRFDDQRATLNLLPEVLHSTGVTGQESDQLFNLVSRIQGSRIDDQRCSAPHIQLGSPAPPRKSHSRPASQTVPPSQSGPTRTSASFSPVSENQEQNSFDQDQFFSLVHHLQQSPMDDQRCSFEPSKYSSSTIKTPNTTSIALSKYICAKIHF
ncbi:G-protein-signaling modulator 1-like [Triplophysa dalaica]|uniref:G-protein-signaling modulator 1-like n=1 Tax=Triplophysa dalaica TaxID=1582913 RepID=UPI0024DF3AE0|nr:G-protein-signaling modulator 1-like [Triplophysa dalaica]